MGVFEKFAEYLFGPNWRTTINGILVFISLVISEIAVEYDTDWLRIAGRVVAGLGILNGFRTTRDRKVSDQESGIPPERTSPDAFANYVRKHGPDNVA